jgi:UDP-N-acetylmuramoyl-L-alanyl-D-glutamate--2,6-diaminopimelate ligase
MRLHDLLSAGAPGVLTPADANPEISGLAYDSRRVRPGTLFFCVPGQQTDGHLFAPQAVEDGAAALVLERPLDLGVPEVQVSSARSAMATVAARFYEDPSSTLQVVGITGTNGKTTTAYMVRALLEAGGGRCGLLGTVKTVVGGVERAAQRTTPEALDLQADFRQMLDAGEQSCAMEVSSHALELQRTAGVRFAAAVFTNLTQDHLDFHHSMESYFQAKRKLFVGPQAPPVKVLNVGDPYGARLARELDDAVGFGLECDADYVASDVRIDSQGASARLATPDGEAELTLPLPGRFNLANALGALAVVHRLGGDLPTLLAALARGVRVPGRFEPVEEGQGFAVLVDYAHTPDSLQNVLSAARELIAADSRGRVLCVFGAGGDRDRGKRSLMGAAAAGLADVVILTSDNPRSEDPHAIIRDILSGVEQTESGASVHVNPHRGEAIGEAIGLAQAGDVVVIAGKGHEQGIELADGVKIPFDDATVAREALRARRR